MKFRYEQPKAGPHHLPPENPGPDTVRVQGGEDQLTLSTIPQDQGKPLSPNY